MEGKRGNYSQGERKVKFIARDDRGQGFFMGGVNVPLEPVRL